MRAWDYPKNTVRIACNKCGRNGQYTKERFIELVGRNTSLPQALGVIARSCDRANLPAGILDNRCKAHYPDLTYDRITETAALNGRPLRG